MSLLKPCAIACILFCCCISAGFASDTLSPDARFTLITCSPGPDLYSVFGHTAIRLEDVQDGKLIDEVYNYGTFDFPEPGFANEMGFYADFSRGQLPYKLSKSPFGFFQQEYLYTGRGIWEQELLFSQQEKQLLYDLLEENYQPENRTYRYDFFYDNCSTRVRDIICKAADNNVTFTYTYPRVYTYRQALQVYLDYKPWSDFGIDLALGMPCDREIGYAQFMFLPDSLMNEFRYALNGDMALVKPDAEIIPQEYELSQTTVFTPLLVFVLFLVVHVLMGGFLLRQGRSPFQWTDRLIFFSVGIVGVLVAFLWFFTDHDATKWNLNLLWANPLLVWAAFARSQRWTGWRRNLLQIYFVLLLITLIGWFMLPQRFHIAVIPILFALVFTCVKILRPSFFLPRRKLAVVNPGAGGE